MSYTTDVIHQYLPQLLTKAPLGSACMGGPDGNRTLCSSLGVLKLVYQDIFSAEYPLQRHKIIIIIIIFFSMNISNVYSIWQTLKGCKYSQFSEKHGPLLCFMQLLANFSPQMKYDARGGPRHVEVNPI